VTFNERIERIIGAGGGLVVIVLNAELDDESQAQALSSDDLPVVVLDMQTFTALQRLGGASPFVKVTAFYQREESEAEINPFLKIAKEKLHSAELLDLPN
jgi:hypothetical protein